MGHALDFTENYERAELEAFLVAHGALIRAKLAAVEAKATAKRRRAMRLA
jgi:hypothetical protein